LRQTKTAHNSISIALLALVLVLSDGNYLQLEHYATCQ